MYDINTENYFFKCYVKNIKCIHLFINLFLILVQLILWLYAHMFEIFFFNSDLVFIFVNVRLCHELGL